MARFNLLRLPIMALIEVFKSMRIQDIFKMSLTSSKTHRTIRSMFSRNFYRIAFRTDETIEINSGNNFSGGKMIVGMEGSEGIGSIYNIGNTMMEVYEKNDIIYCSWTQETEKCFERLLYYLVDLFNNPTVSIDFKADDMPEFPLKVINYFDKMALPLWDVNLRVFMSHETAYMQLLKICCNAKYLTLRGDRFGFQSPFRPERPDMFKCDFLTINDGLLVHLEDFMDCKSLHVSQEKANKEELKDFFRKWVNSNCRLEKLTISVVYKIDFPDIVKDLGGSKIEESSGKMQVKVQRKDGKKALIWWASTDLSHDGQLSMFSFS